MNSRGENAMYLRLHRIQADGSAQTLRLKVDAKTQTIVEKVPASSESAPAYHDLANRPDFQFVFGRNAVEFNESAFRLIKLGHVDDACGLNLSADATGSPDGNAESESSANLGTLFVRKRESKIPNIPTMIRCQNCDTNFPTKYQFQRHQCEFNAEKVVLKPNVDAKDVEKGLRMKFDCLTCGKQFVSKNNLERHVTSHDEDNVNICEYCNKQFVSENRLRIHKENHCKKAGDISKFYRSDVTVWKCLKCYQVFSSDNYANIHAEICTDIVDPEEQIIRSQNKTITISDSEDGDFANANKSTEVEKVLTELLLQCEYCNRTYSDKKSLLLHQKTHSTEVNYQCVICWEHFESYAVAAKHWLTKCSNEASLFYLPKLTYCQYCDRTFKSHEVLYSHKIKKKHYTQKKFVSTQATKITTANEADDGESKENIIKLIEEVLQSIKLKVNENEASGENKENESEVLVKAEVTSDTSLVISEDAQDGDGAAKRKRGRKRKHAPPNNNKAKKTVTNLDPGFKYQCERCVKVFDSVSELENHRDKDHPANYKCEECDQVVHSSKALLIHSRAHQSLKPYVCEICKRCYSQTSHLWQHMRFHQGIKPFACPHEGCEARYTIRPDLKDHIRKVHTRERPFKCSVCDKCFLTGSVYYQHRLIHTNDRRYACDICNKRFFRADALNNHRRIHTDERPYPCDVCGRHFRQKGDRNKHVRTQHPDYQI